jgi:hypothetical protein
VGLTVLTSAPLLHSDADAVRFVPAMQRYLEQSDAGTLTHYRAFRRIEAQGVGHTGWLEAWTELNDGVFTYQVVAEGGSEKVRRRVLHKYLENERQAIATGEVQRSTLTPENYEFEPSAEQPVGLVKILMKPRHKGKLMLEGAMFLAARESDLVRVEGRAVSNPSFWVRRVQITKHYRRINGLTVPVSVDSTANIRFAGKATFNMSYRYSELNGLPTLATGTLASGVAR